MAKGYGIIVHWRLLIYKSLLWTLPVAPLWCDLGCCSRTVVVIKLLWTSAFELLVHTAKHSMVWYQFYHKLISSFIVNKYTKNLMFWYGKTFISKFNLSAHCPMCPFLLYKRGAWPCLNLSQPELGLRSCSVWTQWHNCTDILELLLLLYTNLASSISISMRLTLCLVCYGTRLKN